jgi:hypothetical protein
MVFNEPGTPWSLLYSEQRAFFDIDDDARFAGLAIKQHKSADDALGQQSSRCVALRISRTLDKQLATEDNRVSVTDLWYPDWMKPRLQHFYLPQTRFGHSCALSALRYGLRRLLAKERAKSPRVLVPLGSTSPAHCPYASTTSTSARPKELFAALLAMGIGSGEPPQLTLHIASRPFRVLPGTVWAAGWNWHTRARVFVSGVGVETGIS